MVVLSWPVFTLFQVLDEGPRSAFLQPGPEAVPVLRAVWGLNYAPAGG